MTAYRILGDILIAAFLAIEDLIKITLPLRSFTGPGPSGLAQADHVNFWSSREADSGMLM